MLWDVIYEFFVKYVFGGYFGGDYYSTFFSYDNYQGVDFTTNDVAIKLFEDVSYETGVPVWISFGNYLSLISTIITIVAILLFCVFIIKKIIGIVFRLFTGSSSF